VIGSVAVRRAKLLVLTLLATIAGLLLILAGQVIDAGPKAVSPAEAAAGAAAAAAAAESRLEARTQLTPEPKPEMRLEELGEFSATAYGPPWDEMNGSGQTATGHLLNGPDCVVAVDPDLIKLGSRLRIEPNPAPNFCRYYRALDTGGAIDARRIDFYDWRGRTSQYAWGVRPVTVWLLGH